MPFVTNQLMAHIRSQVSQLLTDTCTIERNEEVTDNRYGSKKPGWVVVASSVACRINLLNRSNQSLVEVMGGQEAMLDSYQLVLAYDVTIDRDYRITVNGVTYFVTRIESQLTNSAFKQVLLTRKRV